MTNKEVLKGLMAGKVYELGFQLYRFYEDNIESKHKNKFCKLITKTYYWFFGNLIFHT